MVTWPEVVAAPNEHSASMVLPTATTEKLPPDGHMPPSGLAPENMKYHAFAAGLFADVKLICT